MSQIYEILKWRSWARRHISMECYGWPRSWRFTPWSSSLRLQCPPHSTFLCHRLIRQLRSWWYLLDDRQWSLQVHLPEVCYCPWVSL
jgi:hypothetical protein